MAHRLDRLLFSKEKTKDKGHIPHSGGLCIKKREKKKGGFPDDDKWEESEKQEKGTA